MVKATIPWNINQVVKAFKNGSLAFDNAIQRGFVWDKKRMSLLIDTVLRGFTVPPFYTIRTAEKVQTPKGMVSVYDGIDGKQRATTFAKYMDDEFALEGLEPFVQEDGTEIDLNGKKFSELDEDMQDTIKSYGLTVYYFSDITDEEVSEMMSRLNNGKALTGIENARIKSKYLDRIIALAKHPLLSENLSETAIKGYADEDIVMKTLLLMNGDSDLSTKNVRAAYELYDFDSESAKIKTGTLSSVMGLVRDAFSIIKTHVSEKQYKARNFKKMLGKANLICILCTVADFVEQGLIPTDKETLIKRSTLSTLADALERFFNAEGISTDDDYNAACKDGTMRPANVEARNDAFSEHMRAWFSQS